MAASETPPVTLRTRRPWSKKFTPAEIRAVINEYHAGSNTREICKKYAIGRTTLYRWIEQHDAMPVDEHDLMTLRIEMAALKDLIVKLALENKQLRSVHDRHTDQTDNLPTSSRSGGPGDSSPAATD